MSIRRIAYLYLPAYLAKKNATGQPSIMQQVMTIIARKIVLTKVLMYISSTKNSLKLNKLNSRIISVPSTVKKEQDKKEARGIKIKKMPIY